LSLLKRCFPLMLVTVSGSIIISYSRYSIERIYDTEALGVFVPVTAPTLIIQVAVSTAFAIISNLFAECLKNGEKKKFIKLFIGFFAAVVFLTLSAAGVSHFIGDWGLNLLYGDSILPYSYLLTGAVFVVGLTSILWFLNMVFISIRDITGVFFCNIIGVIICFATTDYFLKNYYLDGANYVMIVSQGVAAVCLLLRLFWVVKKQTGFIQKHS